MFSVLDKEFSLCFQCYTRSFHCIFSVIQGVLKDKPRILVTHQLQFLKSASQIIILKEVSYIIITPDIQRQQVGLSIIQFNLILANTPCQRALLLQCSVNKAGIIDFQKVYFKQNFANRSTKLLKLKVDSIFNLPPEILQNLLNIFLIFNITIILSLHYRVK